MFALANLLPERWSRASSVPAAVARTEVAAALENVSCVFPSGAGHLVAVDGVTLEIKRGEFVCLLGPSGSGKSTVLNLIAGLLRPTTGKIFANGAEIEGPASDRAVVFQDAGLFPWLTLQANVEFPLKLKGMSSGERAETAERLLRLVQLWRFRDRFPHELSGGMRQRGAIARALAGDPAVLLMDEPFASLDAQTREMLQTEVERIWLATHKTVVFVTHSVTEAVRLADRIVLMGTRPGRILHDVAVPLSRPRDVTDARFVSLVREASRVIATEVEKVAREELADGS